METRLLQDVSYEDLNRQEAQLKNLMAQIAPGDVITDPEACNAKATYRMSLKEVQNEMRLRLTPNPER